MRPRLTLRTLLLFVSIWTLFLMAAAPTQGAVKVTLAPPVVDAGQPATVVVGASNSADAELLRKAVHAAVDGVRVSLQVSTAGEVTVTPPPGVAGTKQLRLLDASEGVIAESPLEYRTAPAADPPGPVNGRQEVVAQSIWYYALVTLLFGATVLPFTGAIVASVWRGPLQQGSNNAPLGLPVGTVRAILAFCLVVYLGFYVLASVLSLSDFRPPDFLTGVVATVIGFYFGSRSDGAPARSGPMANGLGPGAPFVTTGVITGSVARSDGAPAARATVALSRATSPETPVNLVEADATGTFRFEAVEPGEFLLTATLGGVASAPTSVIVQADATTSVVLTLPA